MFLPTSFLLDRSGSTLPVFGVGLLAIFALVGAALSISMDSGTANKLQSSADSAALAGATAFVMSETASADENMKLAKAAARTYAVSNFGVEPKSLSVGSLTIDEFGQHMRVEVELEFHPSNIFNRFGGKNAERSVRRTAIAEATRGFPLCLLALETAATGITISDQGELNAAACAIWSNSPDFRSIVVEGTGKFHAASICSVGYFVGDVPGRITPRPSKQCNAIPDPLRSWNPPAIGRCTSVGGFRLTQSGIKADLSPGVFCGGLWAVSKTVELQPGLYVIKDGPLVLNSSDTLIGNGVTFLLSGNNASVQIEGEGKLILTAPTEGPYAGIALAEDRTTKKGTLLFALEKRSNPDAEPFLTSTEKGNGQIEIEGLIYLPTQRMEITGEGWGKKSSPYLQIVARQIDISGLGKLLIDFRPAEISVPVVIQPERIARLVN